MTKDGSQLHYKHNKISSLLQAGLKLSFHDKQDQTQLMITGRTKNSSQWQAELKIGFNRQ
jgi:hypothetical protein